MAHAFTPIPGKPSFGTLKENLYQSDYLTRKKGLITYCNSSSYCNKITFASSYNQYNLFNIGRYVNSLENCNVIPVNKGNLIIGQYSKLNLQDVCTVSVSFPPIPPFNNVACQSVNNPVAINNTENVPFYQQYTIDPLGRLFGLSQCGELNYIEHMVFYPPTLTSLNNN